MNPTNTETITISNVIGTRDRYTSKYGHLYARVDEALSRGEELTLDDFSSFKRALLVESALRMFYQDRAYISFSKYGRNGVIAPKITISPRGI